jgi:hypothetical protein
MRAMLPAVALLAVLAGPARAAFIVEVDTDGLDDGAVTFSGNFAFGNDTTLASSSVAATTVGLTGGDSIFGGDGTLFPDTYLYSYAPGVDGDNAIFAAGTALNGDGDTASGATAGDSGQYRVYATWPFTTNVGGGPTTYTLVDDLATTLFSVDIDQNGGGAGAGDEWIFLGQAALDDSRSYTLLQQAGINSFVSMRAAGVLFDLVDQEVPEPSAVALLALGLGGLVWRRRRPR